jgi:hypothetical protein
MVSACGTANFAKRLRFTKTCYRKTSKAGPRNARRCVLVYQDILMLHDVGMFLYFSIL